MYRNIGLNLIFGEVNIEEEGIFSIFKRYVGDGKYRLMYYDYEFYDRTLSLLKGVDFITEDYDPDELPVELFD